MPNSSGNIITVKEMEQVKGIIYEGLRTLFFTHVHRKLPRFEEFEAPKIELSDEIKTKTFGKYSFEQIIEVIKKEIKEIESMLGQIRPDERLKSPWLGRAVELLYKIIGCCERRFEEEGEPDHLLESLRDLLDEAKAEGRKDFNNDECKEIKEIHKKIIEAIEKAIELLKNVKKEKVILGKFFADYNLIILYTEANDRCRGQSTLRNRMLATLAHELFHAMHFFVTDRDKWYVDDNKTGSTVIESLARWAEYCWCKHLNQMEFGDIAEKMKREWEIRDFPADPYAGAGVFDNEGVTDLDIEVLEASLTGWNKAYKMMESHKNSKFLNDSPYDEAEMLYRRLVRKKLIRNPAIKEWAIIHPHDSKMTEWHNLKTCALVQNGLARSGFAVTRIPCKDKYLKRSNDWGWGDSALLLIIKDGACSADLYKEIKYITDKRKNTQGSFWGAVLLQGFTNNNVVRVIAEGANSNNLDKIFDRYRHLNKSLILSIFSNYLYQG